MPTMSKEYEEGGLIDINIDCISDTIKINRLKSLLKNENSLWFHILSYIFSQLGGVNFLLK